MDFSHPSLSFSLQFSQDQNLLLPAVTHEFVVGKRGSRLSSSHLCFHKVTKPSQIPPGSTSSNICFMCIVFHHWFPFFIIWQRNEWANERVEAFPPCKDPKALCCSIYWAPLKIVQVGRKLFLGKQVDLILHQSLEKEITLWTKTDYLRYLSVIWPSFKHLLRVTWSWEHERI